MHGLFPILNRAKDARQMLIFRRVATVTIVLVAIVFFGLAIFGEGHRPPLEGKMENLGLQPILPVTDDRAGSPWSALQHWQDGWARTFIVDIVPERKNGKGEALRTVFNACADGKWQIKDGKISVMKYTGRHENTAELAYFVKCDK